jgi:myo-inositol 2-dehydrogenase / D-chiro-inositol 1-dehydrogenase
MTVPAGFAILGAAIDAPEIHANAWVKAARRTDDVDLVGVWDHDAERGRGKAAAWDVPFITDLDDLLADPAVQMVGICAENDRHADLAVRAAGAGKHILCEKPMALTLADCDRMIAAVEAAGVTFMPCFPKRFCVIHQQTKDLVASGELGRVSSARIRHSHFLGYVESFRNTWFTDPARAGGGAVVDQAIHALDFLRWVFGEPESVTAEMTTLLPGLDVEDNVVALLRFPADVLVVLQSSWTQQAGESTVEIFGERGTLIQSYGDLASIRAAPEGDPAPLKVWRADGEPEGWAEYDLPLFHKKSHEVQAEAFFATITAGAPAEITATDGRRAVELVEAVSRAASEGARIDL